MAATDRLRHRAEALGDMLGVLARLTNEASAVLDVFDGSLAQLGDLTAPIHARATALMQAQRNAVAAKAEVDELLGHLDAARRLGGPLVAGPSADLPAFLEALEALERSVAFLRGRESLAAVRPALGSAQALFERALAACDADFSASLADATAERAPPPSWLLQQLADGAYPSEDTVADYAFELVPADIAPQLQRMAAVMLDAGYARGRDGYVAARERVLEAALRAAGQDTPSPLALASLAPSATDRVAGAWARRLQALALLAPSERRLAAAVWPAPQGEQLFSSVVGGQLSQLARAGRDIVDAARRAPERLFALLDAHAALGFALRSLQASLAGNSPPWLLSSGTPSAAGRAVSRDDEDATGDVSGTDHDPLRAVTLLGELAAVRRQAAGAARAVFADYASLVARDVSRLLPPDGTVHPLTAQAVGYVKRLLSYDSAAEVLFGGGSSGGGGGGGEDRGDLEGGAAEARARLADAVGRLIAALLDNLEAKARGYPRAEPSLPPLFLMNNAHYVVWSSEGGAVEGLLGREWLEARKDAVEEFGARYHEAAWAPVLAPLRAEPPQDVARLKAHLKEAFSSFNAAVERVASVQSAWTIPDAQLRAAVRRVIKADVADPYQGFLGRYADVQFSSTPARYIRFTAADVRAIVDGDLFESKSVPAARLDLKQAKMAAIM